MTRLILWAYSLLAWVFWLGTDSIDIVSQNTPIAPMRSASKSLTAISRHASNQDDARTIARTAILFVNILSLSWNVVTCTRTPDSPTATLLGQQRSSLVINANRTRLERTCPTNWDLNAKGKFF